MIANVAAADTYLNWCGKEWWVRSGTGNPGGNHWSNSDSSVWVDENQKLHLTIQKSEIPGIQQRLIRHPLTIHMVYTRGRFRHQY